ncbi:MAG TPA: hypothetical protein PK636_01770 [bacterium]|nr:hypothetical protein [bacterium]HPJ71393.1 hypothetical protein [bacterium]HPQ67197.1 hypothetical protein [bacterium]
MSLLSGFLTVVFLTSANPRPSPPPPPAAYGLSANDPIPVGGESFESGPRYERAYLNHLRGPRGERIAYERTGSCCPFETPNSPFGAGLLDVYRVTYPGMAEPVDLYLNMYDPPPARAPSAPVPAPPGFTYVE